MNQPTSPSGLSAVSQDFISSMVDAFPAPMCTLDRDLNIIQHNDVWASLSIHPSSIFYQVQPGQSYREIAQCGEGMIGSLRLVDVLESFLESDLPAISETYRFVPEAGEVCWYQVDARFLPGRRGKGLVVSHLDVTSRMLTEQALQREREFLELVIDQIPHGVFWKDEQGKFVGCNQSFSKYVACKTPWDIIGKMDHQIYEDAQEAAKQSEEDREILATAKPVVDKRYVRVVDQSPRQYIMNKVPLPDDLGVPRGVLGVLADITNTTQLENQLQQARRLEAIGQLSAGIAHEINTPMQYVGDNVHFLERATSLLMEFAQGVEALAQGDGGDESIQLELQALLKRARIEALKKRVPRAVEGAKEGVGAVSKIVQAMKGFAHPGAHDKQMADLNNAIETTMTIARNEWKYVAKVELELDASLSAVECDVAELNQVFLNLLVNASHAVADAHDSNPEQGLITITTSQLSETHVELRFRDNGVGIPEEHFARLFEPFFTTKEVGKGTGQGLAISHSVVVDHHQGKLFCESELGVGTTFVIQLPVKQDLKEEGQ